MIDLAEATYGCSLMIESAVGAAEVPTTFSAERAYADLQRMAGPEPISIGSLAGDAVRDYLVSALSTAGLSVAETDSECDSERLGVGTRFEIFGRLATGREPVTHHPNTKLVDPVGYFQGQRDGTEHAGLD